MGISAGKKLLTSDAAKKLGTTALDIGKEATKNVIVDMLEGKDVKETLNKELESAKSKIASTIKGSGRKRARKRCIKPAKKGRYSLLD